MPAPTVLKFLQYGLGIGFIVLGVAGLFLPILQGILFIALGIFILKADSLGSALQRIKSRIGSKKKK